MDSNDPRPTWTDPAPAAPLATPTQPVTPGAPAVVAPPRKGRSVVDWLLVGAAVLAIGGVAFAAGRATAPPTTAGVGTFPGGGALGGGAIPLDPNASFDPGAGPAAGNGRPGFLGAGGGLTIDGNVTAVDGSTLTLRLESGETTTVTLDETTTYHVSAPSDASSVAVGDDVSVHVSIGGLGAGGDGAGATPSFTASDVTVTR